jgi:hypothetical protein
MEEIEKALRNTQRKLASVNHELRKVQMLRIRESGSAVESKQLDYRAHMKTENYASPTKAPSTARTITQRSRSST